MRRTKQKAILSLALCMLFGISSAIAQKDRDKPDKPVADKPDKPVADKPSKPSEKPSEKPNEGRVSVGPIQGAKDPQGKSPASGGITPSGGVGFRIGLGKKNN